MQVRLPTASIALIAAVTTRAAARARTAVDKAPKGASPVLREIYRQFYSLAHSLERRLGRHQR